MLALLSFIILLWALPCKSTTLGSWFWGIRPLLGNSAVQIPRAQRAAVPVSWLSRLLNLHPQSRVLSPFLILLSYCHFLVRQPISLTVSPQAAQVQLAAIIPPISVDFGQIVSLLLNSVLWFPDAHVCSVSTHLSRIAVYKQLCGFSPKCAWTSTTASGLVQIFWF